MLLRIIITFLGLLSFTQVFAQIDQDTTKNNENQNPDLIIQNDSTGVSSDSTLIMDQFTLDSIAQRQEFVRDSLIARAKFVKDSLYQRKLILDSVTFLKRELPMLVAAAMKSTKEEIIIYTDQVNIIGDSTLSDFTYRVISQKMEEPYAPWRSTIKLSGKSFKIKIDTINKKVLSVRSPKVYYSFNYDSDKRIVRMNGRSTILSKRGNNYYKFPIDSVFFDSQGRVKKVKKYVHYFNASKTYKKGASLAVDITQVKEFNYFSDGVLSSYRLINYCDRWGGRDINKECHIVTYSITREGEKYTVLKKSKPSSVFSDGTFIFRFDNNFDLKGIEFTNVNKSLKKKCIIELNKDRNVSRYLYEENGRINRSIIMTYDNSPNAKYKVEAIEYYFEKNNISYYQINLTTGKKRTRDRLTLKWNPWK